MSKKVLISLTNLQGRALAEMMAADLANNRSAFIAALIGREYKKRADEDRKPGRPPIKKVDDYSDDLPKTIPHFGKMIGARELADFEDKMDEKAWLDKSEKS